MQNKKYDVYQPLCPSHRLLQIIGDKWVILIIHKLSIKTLRFGELQREIGGISKKVLAATLKTLEENAIIVRRVYDEKVLKVEYSLTELGDSLNQVCGMLTQWAEENISVIERFQSERF